MKIFLRLLFWLYVLTLMPLAILGAGAAIIFVPINFGWVKAIATINSLAKRAL